ncbi:MAG TPA: hypothetical protein PLB96_07275 [Syntrophales bacterium]|nr:hypothetical protein [Syntrophales bacterium]
MIFRTAIAILLLLACAQAVPQARAAGPPDREVDDVLTCAESLFKAQEARRYGEIWQFLTVKTKKSIVEAVYERSKRAGGEMDKKGIASDFAAGGTIARAYWDGYLLVFKPGMVLDESRWTIGGIKKDKAEILILHRKSERPAVLQLFREDGMWKVGLDETFGARDLLANFP